MKNVAAATLAALVGMGLSACSRPTGRLHEPPAAPRYDRPLPPGRQALRKLTDPREIPDFTRACSDRAGLRQAIDYSLSYLSKPSSRKFFPSGDITHKQAVESLKAFGLLLESGPAAGPLNRAIGDLFDVYVSVGCDDKGTVLFTGYYTPIFEAAPRRGGKFQYPLYKQPSDLAKAADGTVLGRRGSDGALSPYPARREIEKSKLLAGQELYWLKDAFEVYIAHVQGSAMLRLPDGRRATVGYAATNGHDYKSVAQKMVTDGRVSAATMSLQAMIAYFRDNPKQVRKYLWHNPRYVFFTETDTEPRGCLNEPVVAMRSIATDKSIFPRACLAMIATRLPRMRQGQIVLEPYSGFALDQDAGGAIRAPGRCDVYMGAGDQAGELAGRTQQEGKLYYLFLKAKSDG